MKRFDYNFFWVIVMIMLGFASCKNETVQSGPKDRHLVLADTILNVYNSDRQPYDLGMFNLGPANIVVTENKVVIEQFVATANETMSYFMQTDEKLKAVKSGPIGNSQIIFTERYILVNSLEQDLRYLFTINSDAVPWFEKQVEGLKTYNGYGIGVRKVMLGSPPDKAPYCKCLYPDTYAFVCNAGGSEQIQCGTANDNGACKVSCNNKTYPCCDMGQE